MKNWATLEGTLRFKQKQTEKQSLSPAHFRQEQGLWLSSIGLGTYLGKEDQETDTNYAKAIETAIESGCNFLDTAINYRHQRSERVIGSTLKNLFEKKKIERDEVVVATKGGFIPFDTAYPADPYKYLQDHFVKYGALEAKDIVAGCHVMTPRYLEFEITQSLKNLELDTLDIYYIHNPETQLEKLSKEAFYTALWDIFEMLENQVSLGRIRYYGAATWNGFRMEKEHSENIQLQKIVQIAEEVAGIHHHFRFVQLPFNLAMPEALSVRNQHIDGNDYSVLAIAKGLGLSVVTSASIMQGQLSRDLPKEFKEKLNGLTTDAQRALQFVRSTPGVTTALVGMGQPQHAKENLETAKTSPIPEEKYQKLFLQN